MIKIMKYNQLDDSAIFDRGTAATDVSATVSTIIDDVRKNGDEALLRYCDKFDGAKLSSLETTEQEFDEAMSAVSDELLGIFRRAAENIRAFHSRQIRNSFIVNDNNGIITGQKIIPIEKAGLYVPGGTAAYPSTVLMNAIPAKLAGCSQICIVTPPGKDGKINPAILAAARIAGVDRVFKSGGAQAVAALAYGTQSIPKVDKIVGPGNAFVAEAKRQVFGLVSIDMIAGPSEILIVADSKSNAKVLAADMLSQAEHDRMASAVLLTDSAELAAAVSKELERQLELLDRRDIARDSVDSNGKIIVTQDIEQAVEVANRIAPEHLELCVDNPFDYLDKVKNAGSIFMGRHCPEALGDYFAGPNHTLPTGATARFSSPLSVDDFVKKSQYIYYSADALESVKDDIAAFAQCEGLSAHAKSALVRFEN